MVFDCFSFFNELDLLEIRLNVLSDVVDKFVLVEAVKTHTGKSKPLYYKENASRFAKFADKIIHIAVTDFSIAESLPESRNRAWIIENIQRNAIAKGLCNAHDDDVVLISDVDEIPRPESVSKAISAGGIVRLALKSCNYYLNYRNYVSPDWKLGTQVLRYSDFKNASTYKDFKYTEFVVKEANPLPSASMVRFLKSTTMIKNAGWHFSYLGGVGAIRQKLNAFAHTEFNSSTTSADEWILSRISAGEDLFKRGDRFFVERIDESYPDYIRLNQGLYQNLIMQVDEEYFKKTRHSRVLARIKGCFMRFAAACVPEFCVPFVMSLRDKINGVANGQR